MPTHAEIERALAGVDDPLLGESLAALGMVYAVHIQRGGRVAVELLAPVAGWPGLEALAEAATQALESLAGVTAASVQWVDGSAWTPQRLAPALRAPLNLADDDPSSHPGLWARFRQKLP